MSKYNSYARKLSEAFIKARTEYITAFERLQKATADRTAANQWRQEKHYGENAVKKARAEADYLAAKAEFEAAEARVWAEFNQQRAELRSELEKEVKGDGLANPDAVDGNALELLKSGVLTPDDFAGLAKRFDDNPTMLKLLAKYAQDAANATDDRAARGALLQIALDCKDGQGSVMNNWGGLSRVADCCSGQSRGRKSPPEYIVNISGRWEDMSHEATENF